MIIKEHECLHSTEEGEKMLFHTLDENCMGVECEIGLGATGESKKEIYMLAN
jgi:hypothetical protein